MQNTNERLEAVGIEFVRYILTHDFEHPFGAERFAIRSFLRERAIDVRDGEDVRVERKLGGDQAVRIARAVELFMVLSGDASDVLEAVNAGENLLRKPGMTLDYGKFFRR